MTLPQGPVPVSGVFPAGVTLAPSGDWDSGNPAFAISRGSPGAPLPTPGHDRRFPGMLFSPFTFRITGQPSDPRDTSSRPCPLRGRYNAAPRGAATTPTGHTDRSTSTRPQAPLPHPPGRPSDRYDETGSAASSTSICRSHDVTEFSAPTTPVGALMISNHSVSRSRIPDHPGPVSPHLRSSGPMPPRSDRLAVARSTWACACAVRTAAGRSRASTWAIGARRSPVRS